MKENNFVLLFMSTREKKQTPETWLPLQINRDKLKIAKGFENNNTNNA